MNTFSLFTAAMPLRRPLALVAMLALVLSMVPFATVTAASDKTFTATVSPTSIEVGETKNITFTITNTSSSGGGDNRHIKSGRVIVPSGFSVSNWSTSRSGWITSYTNRIEFSDSPSDSNAVEQGESFTVSMDVTNNSAAAGQTAWEVCVFSNQSNQEGDGAAFNAGTGMTAGGCGINVPFTVTEPAPTTGSLTVTKVVENEDASEPKEVGDFNLYITPDGGEAVSVTSGEEVSGLTPGLFVVSEDEVDNYVATFSGGCNDDGEITVVAGESASCTITNTYVDPGTPVATGTLEVRKVVVDSEVNANNFSFILDDGTATTSFDFDESGSNSLEVAVGTYTVTEAPVADYTATYDNCTNVAVVEGETTVCTITNTYQASSVVDDAQISPILECVANLGDGVFEAHFGYETFNNVTITIPEGDDNKLTGNAAVGGVITEFSYPAPNHPSTDRMGRSGFYPDNAFSVRYTGAELVWTLTGPDGQTRTATAGQNSPVCPTPPPPVVDLCTLSVVSDTTNIVEDSGEPAVETFVHPNWVQNIVDSFATWIWRTEKVENPRDDETNTFIKEFVWNGDVSSSHFEVATDNTFSASLNGEVIASSDAEDNFSTTTKVTTIDTDLFETGTNTLAITVTNLAADTDNPEANPAGLLYDLTIVGVEGVDCTTVPDDSEPEITPEPEPTVGGGTTRRRSSSGSRPLPTVAGAADSVVEETPAPETPAGLVLGEQVSVVPVGGAATGAGGTAPSSTPTATITLGAIAWVSNRTTQIVR